MDHRVQDVDWAEVTSYPDGQTLAVGHLKNISGGGLSLDLPVGLRLGLTIRVGLSRIRPNGLLEHFYFTGSIVHIETLGFGWVHGVKFTPMTQAERDALIEYLCQVEHQYEAAS